ncbi:CMP-N-acetylneuraminate-poly-alpha-2,8-sialyltransferase-like [Diadema antillarum]|uniref:CMP-N-acetylneuraminate-poly-alpha-2, 8-sialyltransferase-like n=1 Tax=Diadema antillarum TaxID=105358 RepID=UPI003A88FB4F
MVLVAAGTILVSLMSLLNLNSNPIQHASKYILPNSSTRHQLLSLPVLNTDVVSEMRRKFLVPMDVQIFRRGIPPKRMEASKKQKKVFRLKQTHSPHKVDTCSIVGNSGVLLDSACGDIIEEADVVIRVNLALFGGEFSRDVGSRVDFMTLNGKQFEALDACINQQNASVAIDELQGKCRNWVHNIALIGDSILWYHKGMKTFRQMKSILIYLDKYGIRPRYAYTPYDVVNNIRRLFNVSDPSAGLQVYASATQFCSRITLFGFYPFYKDPTNRTLKYHYFDKARINFGSNLHHMPNEYKVLQQLEDRGAIRVVNDCAKKWDNRTLTTNNRSTEEDAHSH